MNFRTSLLFITLILSIGCCYSQNYGINYTFSKCKSANGKIDDVLSKIYFDATQKTILIEVNKKTTKYIWKDSLVSKKFGETQFFLEEDSSFGYTKIIFTENDHGEIEVNVFKDDEIARMYSGIVGELK